jgi:hypothetical protein
MGSMGLRTSPSGWLYRASKAALNSVLKDASIAFGGRATCGGQIYQRGELFLLPANDAPPVSPADGSCTLLVTTIP